MNRIGRSSTDALFAALVAMTSVLSSAHAAPEVQVRQSGDIAYISGGVSEEARESLGAMARDFNLKLVMATKGGAYLSDVGIVVSDARGQPLLDVKSEGPWFLARLPSGNYAVEATSGGKAVRRNVTIGSATSQLDLRWDE